MIPRGDLDDVHYLQSHESAEEKQENVIKIFLVVVAC